MTIPPTQVGSGGVTEFTLLLTEANLPRELLDLEGPYAANADGSDLRVATNPDGTGLLHVDVISLTRHVDSSQARAILRVGPVALSSSGPNHLWVFYHQPSATPQSGQQAYDASTRGFWPMEEDPSGMSPQLTDRTFHSHHGRAIGRMTSADFIAGKVGRSWEFDGSDDAVELPTFLPNDGDFTVRAWVRLLPTATTHALWGQRAGSPPVESRVIFYAHRQASAGRVRLFMDDAGGQVLLSNSTIDDGQWHFIAATRQGREFRLFIDGVNEDTQRRSGLGSNPLSGYLARRATGENYLGGAVDQFAIDTQARSPAWIVTEYNQTNNSANFAVAGTPEDVGGLPPDFEFTQRPMPVQPRWVAVPYQ